MKGVKSMLVDIMESFPTEEDLLKKHKNMPGICGPIIPYCTTREDIREITEGIYIQEDNWFTEDILNLFIEGKLSDTLTIKPADRKVYSFGVCDNYEQILDCLPGIESSKNKKYFIILKPVLKSEQQQEDRNPFRWHKHGEYIGDREPQAECLKDEPEIEKVYRFRVHEIITSPEKNIKAN